MIHECAHNLIFKRTWTNTLAGMLANLPHVSAELCYRFQRYHLKHHAFQGVYDLDADLPSYWEARLIGKSALGKAIWLMLFPFFQVTRPPRLKEIRMLGRLDCGEHRGPDVVQRSRPISCSARKR